MVCIAAFIILALLSVFVGFLSLFNKALGKKYWATFKKAWHCVFKKVRLQKCDTNFKDEVKNSLLKKVVLKNPKLVKPLSALIEIISVVIVLITVWSLVIAIKSLLALWVFGTCNVSMPSQCGLGAEVCSIDQAEPTDPIGKIGRSFAEWGEIFTAIPDRLKTWDAKDYITNVSIPMITMEEDKKLADYADSFDSIINYYRDGSTTSGSITIDVFDPGCVVCAKSYQAQNKSGFFNNHFTLANIYAIPNGDKYKFENSGFIRDYLYATVLRIKERIKNLSNDEIKNNSELMALIMAPNFLINEIYSGEESGVPNYQAFNYKYETDQLTFMLGQHYSFYNVSDAEVRIISQAVDKHQNQNIPYIKIKERELNQNLANQLETEAKNMQSLVQDKIRAKGIPVEIYDGKKHNGLYKASS